MSGLRDTVWITAAVSLALVGCGSSGEEVQRTASEVTPASTLRPGVPVEGGSSTVVVAEAGGDEGTGETVGTSDGTTTETTGPEEELEPVAPESYGKVVYTADPPPAEELTVHGLAGYEVVAIYDQPDLSSDKLGYLRIGTRLMVTPKIDDAGEGCKKGFHGLPMGGYVCASKGWVVDAERPPFMPHAPPKPRLDDAHPYDYGYVRRWNSPMWWRVPTADELKAAELQRGIREAERTGAPVPTENDGGDGGDGGDDGDDVGAAAVDAAADPAEPGPDLATMKLPLSPGSPWLERGYFLSLGEKIREGSRSYRRTARGAYVEANALSGYDAKDYKGIALDDDVAFPVAFVKSKKSKLLELNDDDKLKVVKALERRDFVDVNEETEIGGKAYMITAEGQLVRKDDLMIPELQPLPAGVEPWERWIDVSLSTQMLVAYEGTRPVYVTLVSTGKKGSKEEPFDTPTGRWRIYSKHISSTMDGNTASDGSYSIQDVPWTMFFYGSYALHGAFWHRSFGRVRSHGCVNLGPSDARWLFFWTTPFLPEGWHGVHATDESPGTTVIVRE